MSDSVQIDAATVSFTLSLLSIVYIFDEGSRPSNNWGEGRRFTMTAGKATLKEVQPHKGASHVQADVLSVEEQIRRRAHEIWLERGHQGGSDVLDWLQAEEEITALKK